MSLDLVPTPTLEAVSIGSLSFEGGEAWSAPELSAGSSSARRSILL